EPIALIDIALTAVLIYGVFSLIQGTRAVRLVFGAIILYLVFVMAQALNLVLLSGIMQAAAVVGLLALVVVFQPELRRGLDRLGRVGSLGWLGQGNASGYQRIASVLANSAAILSKRRAGALIVVERDSGLGDMAETGVAINGDLSTELLTSLFAPGYPVHDGAVIVSSDQIVAAGAMLPLAQRLPSKERYGTRHRAALGVTEQTDALAIVVSEETGAISLAEGGGILRELDEEELRQRLYSLLRPADVARRARIMASRGTRDRASTTSSSDAAGKRPGEALRRGDAAVASKPSAQDGAATNPGAAGTPE
ncbi:MAG: diadenylate cyclase CdaA, partial [Chloroflexota bacterium]